MTDGSSTGGPHRRWIWLIIAAIGFGVTGFAYRQDMLPYASDARAAAKPPSDAVATRPAPVTVAAAIRREIVQSVAVSGSLVMRDEVLVSPQVDGVRLEAFHVDVGDKVKAGQVLARLDRSMIEARLLQNASELAKSDAAIAQAGAALAEAEASSVETAAALERGRKLKTSGTVTDETLIARDTAAKVAEARVAAQRQNLRFAQASKALVEAQRGEIELELARTEVRAPVAGVIANRSALVGHIAGTSGEPLFRIIRDGQVELQADVPEDRLHSIQAGQAVQVQVSGTPERVVGEVRLVGPTVDPTTRLGKVWIAMPEDPALRPGRFAQGVIATVRRDGVVVPRSSVLFGGDGARVQLVESGVVTSRVITAGMTDAEGTEVIEGLDVGQDVVVSAGAFLHDGDFVTPVREDRVAELTPSALGR